MFEDFLPYIQIGISLLLILVILFQRSESGVGGAFGGGDTTSAEFRTRRGGQRVLFVLTIILALAFVAFTAIPAFFL